MLGVASLGSAFPLFVLVFGAASWGRAPSGHTVLRSCSQRRKYAEDIVGHGRDKVGEHTEGQKAKEIESSVGVPVIRENPHVRAEPQALPHKRR